MRKFSRITQVILPILIVGSVLGGTGMAGASTTGQDGGLVPGVSAIDAVAAAKTRAAIVANGKDAGVVTAAAGGWNRCPNGYFCLFSGRDGTGLMAYFRTGSPNLAGQGMDNAASSQWNRSPWVFNAYDDYNYRGYGFSHDPGTRYSYDWWHGEDQWSSVRRR